MKTQTIWLLSGLVLLLLVACEPEVPIATKIYRPVQYVKVVQQGGELMQTFSGVIEPALDAQLSFRVSGTIAKRHVRLGETVSTGQLLIELDATDYRVSAQQAQANLMQAIANQRNQEANYQRVTELYENSNASKSDLDAARAGAESAKAATAISRKQLESAQLQLSYTQIKAPQACSIAAIQADTNETVIAGQSVIRINCGKCPKVNVSVPELFIQSIKTGNQVEVSTSATPNKVFPAIVSEVGVAAGSGGTFPVEAILDGECPELRTGMTANLKFDFSSQIFGQSKSQLFVPYLSVGEDDQGHFVFVLLPMADGIYQAKRRSVVVGQEAQNGMQIVSGIEPGDRVATAGVRRLLDGMEVRLLDKPILGIN